MDKEHEAPAWMKKHEADDDRRFTELADAIAKLPDDARTTELLNKALTAYFERKGTLAKNIVVTAAIVVGSLTVIFGGAKAILMWIGFTYVK
jgi:hypothetical protein